MKQNQYLVPAAILAVVILIVAFKPNIESAWIQKSTPIHVGMHIDEAVRRIGSPRETISIKKHAEGDSYRDITKHSPEKFILDEYKAEDYAPTKITYGYSDEILFNYIKSVQRQDPEMNKNEDQVWLIGDQWIFVDKNKIITSIGSILYKAE